LVRKSAIGDPSKTKANYGEYRIEKSDRNKTFVHDPQMRAVPVDANPMRDDAADDSVDPIAGESD
jgi:hypothetical protein